MYKIKSAAYLSSSRFFLFTPFLFFLPLSLSFSLSYNYNPGIYVPKEGQGEYADDQEMDQWLYEPEPFPLCI